MRQQDKAVKLWFRLKFSPQDKPINHVFQELEHLHNAGHTTWLSKIEHILGDVYHDLPYDINHKRWMSQLKDDRYKKFIVSWLNDINDCESHPKLRTYCRFKMEFRKEPYLYQVNRTYLNPISRFRTSYHCLHIETGRHTKPITPVENRTCNFCQSNCIDDEIHMLLDCTFHNTERKSLLDSIHAYQPSNNNNTFFYEIMQNKSPDFIEALGKYLSTGFRRRKLASEQDALS